MLKWEGHVQMGQGTDMGLEKHLDVNRGVCSVPNNVPMHELGLRTGSHRCQIPPLNQQIHQLGRNHSQSQAVLMFSKPLQVGESVVGCVGLSGLVYWAVGVAKHIVPWGVMATVL